MSGVQCVVPVDNGNVNFDSRLGEVRLDLETKCRSVDVDTCLTFETTRNQNIKKSFGIIVNTIVEEMRKRRFCTKPDRRIAIVDARNAFVAVSNARQTEKTERTVLVAMVRLGFHR